MTSAVARNDPCPCGSGKKYKQCCLKRGGVGRGRQLKIAAGAALAVTAAALAVAFLAGGDAAFLVALGGYLLVGAYLLFGNPPPPKAGGDPGAIRFGG